MSTKNYLGECQMLNQSYLKSILHYDAETGVFIRKRTKKIAGCITSKGYIYIGINRKQIFAHRLAWLYVYGIMPPEQVDHINRNRSDNRISNLRLCNNIENAQNAKLNKNNKSGFKGVSWEKNRKKWQVYVYINKRGKFFGYFDDLHEANLVATNARKKFHPFNTEVI
jgi:hypothetical protein